MRNSLSFITMSESSYDLNVHSNLKFQTWTWASPPDPQQVWYQLTRYEHLLNIFIISFIPFWQFIHFLTKLFTRTLIDWLIDYLRFYVPLKNISLIWRRHHCRWRAANLGLCSALRAFEQGGIFIVPHLLWHGASVFPVSSEGPPHLVAFYDTQGVAEDLF